MPQGWLELRIKAETICLYSIGASFFGGAG